MSRSRLIYFRCANCREVGTEEEVYCDRCKRALHHACASQVMGRGTYCERCAKIEKEEIEADARIDAAKDEAAERRAGR